MKVSAHKSLAIFLSIGFCAFLGFFLAFGIKFLFFYFAPSSYWFEYKGVEPAKAMFEVGEPIIFISSLDVKRDVSLEWNDILFCDLEGDVFGDDFFYFSNYRSENFLSKKGVRLNRPWSYNKAVPEQNAICYLRSMIKANLPFGITKLVEYDGKKNDALFHFVEKKE